MPSRPVRHPDPGPLRTDDVPTVLAGTVAWAVALAVLVVLRLLDAVEVRDWWLGMCAYGIGLGLVGVRITRRRRGDPD